MDRHLSGSSSRKISEVFSSSSSKKLSAGRFSSEEVEAMDRKKYPIRAGDYVLYEEVGHGVSASVYRALCVPLDEIVAIKILDFERSNSDLSNISREAQTMILVDHPNVLRAYCSFVNEHTLWVVMPFMAGGSCLHILKAAYPDGFGETVIATVLREVLKGLEYLHHHGHIHRDVKAGNILIDARGAIKLGDFGVSACLFDSGDRQRARNTFVGTPCWMAPEVMEQLHGYDFKADIWSFGITALELAHGHAPFSKYPPMKVLLMTLQNAPPGLDYERDRKFSKSFKQMIAMCLVKDPSKRPSAHKLLKHSFFKQARSNDYIARILLEGLPDLGDRLRALKLKEADLVAQKKMPDGKKEELSQNEYKRGISGWDFNIEDMKAQASLIQDVDETMPDNELGGSSNCLFGFDIIPDKQLQCTLPISLKDDMTENEDEDAMRNNPVAPLSPGSTAKDLMDNCARTEEESSIGVGTRKPVIVEDGGVARANGIAFDPNENPPEADEMYSKSVATHQSHERKVPSDPCDVAGPVPVLCKVESKQQPHAQTAGTFNMTDDLHSEVFQKVPKLTASNSDAEEKSKGPVVQQRGRFKVTSENVELEKPPPSPALQKSHSMQVIIPHPAISVSSTSDATMSNHLGCTLTPQLHNMLQTINSLRDNFVSLMKQVSNGQVSSGDLPASRVADGGASTPVFAFATDRPSPEAAHEREKELLQEITDLNWRLICAQDELQKLRAKTTQV